MYGLQQIHTRAALFHHAVSTEVVRFRAAPPHSSGRGSPGEPWYPEIHGLLLILGHSWVQNFRALLISVTEVHLRMRMLGWFNQQMKFAESAS